MDTGRKDSVLIIEDEKKISDITRAYLEKEGFSVRVAENGTDALTLFREGPDIIILDLMLPDMAGEELCRIIRESSDVPIIMLTAKSGEEDRVKGLGIGADDYMVKPFSPRELVARVKAHLRRAGKTKKKTLSYNKGSLQLDLERHEVLKGGSPLQLTLTEFKILTALAENHGRILSRNQIVNIVQGYDRILP